MKFRYIKGGALSEGILGPRGFVLGEFLETDERSLSFTLERPVKCDFSFVFGFRGVGNHFRLEYRTASNRFVISQVRDGIPIYLQHAIMDTETSEPLAIRVDDVSIRIFSGKLCFINLVHEGFVDGCWGFGGVGRETPAPDVRVEKSERKNPEWLVLGDGYSNNRWKNRDFFSWPELAYGDKSDYLNACVAAGNTRRVLEIIQHLAHRIHGTNVILAVGADDVMEQEPHSEILIRMQRIVKLLREAGVATIHVTTLVPKPRYPEATKALNEWILNDLSSSCDSVLDFHHVIASGPKEDLQNADFPGPGAQIRLAGTVLEALLGAAPASLLTRQQLLAASPSGMKRFALRFAARASSQIDRFVGRF